MAISAQAGDIACRVTAGIGVPLIGTTAASGLVLFFVGAIITHLRAHDYSLGLALGLAVVFLLLAVAALVLGLYIRRPVA